ncbi:MAG: thiol-disulfide oxidoreductase DCC family protein [Burkholderiales bacterium]
MTSVVRFPLTVYYDVSCPLCANEMHALKAADDEDRLMLVDCSSPAFDDTPFAADGITREAMGRLIHARDAAGRWLIGVAVFEAAYGAVGFAGLARLWGHAWLRPLWDRLYPWVARHRQGLSRLGVQHLFRGLARRASLRAASARCDRDACPATPDAKTLRSSTGNRS